VGPRADLDGRKISSPPEFDPGMSVAIRTELLDPHTHTHYIYIYIYIITYIYIFDI